MKITTLPSPPLRLTRRRAGQIIPTDAEMLWQEMSFHFNLRRAKSPSATGIAVRCCDRIVAVIDHVGQARVLAARGTGHFDHFDVLSLEGTNQGDRRSLAEASDRINTLTCRTCGTRHPTDALRRHYSNSKVNLTRGDHDLDI
ncbi:hypothetical protein [Actinospongicola halichondriae]|uniref:hypothetical protein n=1 Tax=Actinospongicola halichondriae TaxID=3236844 RepID=UPI003D4BF8DE